MSLSTMEVQGYQKKEFPKEWNMDQKKLEKFGVLVIDEGFEKAILEAQDRHCALCLIPIPMKDVKRCSGCRRRAYCSRECQKIDWSTKGNGGQGHKNWCQLDWGEEDVDWKMTKIPGKGVGMVATRALVKNFRVMIDGLIETKKEKSRIIKLNHACDSNCLAWTDLHFKVKFVLAKRAIEPGEELTCSYTHYMEVYYELPNAFEMKATRQLAFFHSLEDCRKALKSQWGIICPADCICRDSNMEKLLLKGKNSYDNLFYNISKNYTADEALQDLRVIGDLIANHHHKIPSHDIFKAELKMLGFKIASQLGRGFRELATLFIKEAYKIIICTFHPMSETAKEAKLYLDHPEMVPDYCALAPK